MDEITKDQISSLEPSLVELVKMDSIRHITDQIQERAEDYLDMDEVKKLAVDQLVAAEKEKVHRLRRLLPSHPGAE